MHNVGQKSLRRIIAAAVAASLMILAATGCGNKSSAENDREKQSLAVSYGVQAYLLKNIAGPKYSVVTLLPPGIDPETYEPSVSELTSLQNSKVYFMMNTPGFEEALLPRLTANLGDKLSIIDVSSGIERIEGTHADKDHGDPHLWSSVRNTKKIAANMTEAMCSIFPDDSATFRNRRDSIMVVLDSLDSSISDRLRGSEGKAFLIPHPSLSYFARDYGLEQISLEHDGKEATPKELASTIEYMEKRKPAVLFYEAGHDSRQAKGIAGKMGIPSKEISLNGEDWVKEMENIAKAIAGKGGNDIQTETSAVAKN